MLAETETVNEWTLVLERVGQGEEDADKTDDNAEYGWKVDGRSNVLEGYVALKYFHQRRR